MKKKETIIKKYIEFELMNGREPHSVYEFCKEYKSNEADFYVHFNSFKQLRKVVLEGLINETLETLNADDDYETFHAKEKMLALFFTVFEVFKTQRSYLLHRYNDKNNWKSFKGDFDLFLLQFNARATQIIQEAKQEETVKDRPMIGAHYSKGFQLVFTYLFRVWVNDESADFETTDAAIEKSVNLSFELLGTSPLDSIIDFGKFALKTKVI